MRRRRFVEKVTAGSAVYRRGAEFRPRQQQQRHDSGQHWGLEE
jgi:hypothetical protein